MVAHCVLLLAITVAAVECSPTSRWMQRHRWEEFNQKGLGPYFGHFGIPEGKWIYDSGGWTPAPGVTSTEALEDKKHKVFDFEAPNVVVDEDMEKGCAWNRSKNKEPTPCISPPRKGKKFIHRTNEELARKTETSEQETLAHMTGATENNTPAHTTESSEQVKSAHMTEHSEQETSTHVTEHPEQSTPTSIASTIELSDRIAEDPSEHDYLAADAAVLKADEEHEDNLPILATTSQSAEATTAAQWTASSSIEQADRTMELRTTGGREVSQPADDTTTQASDDPTTRTPDDTTIRAADETTILITDATTSRTVQHDSKSDFAAQVTASSPELQTSSPGISESETLEGKSFQEEIPEIKTCNASAHGHHHSSSSIPQMNQTSSEATTLSPQDQHSSSVEPEQNDYLLTNANRHRQKV